MWSARHTAVASEPQREQRSRDFRLNCAPLADARMAHASQGDSHAPSEPLRGPTDCATLPRGLFGFCHCGGSLALVWPSFQSVAFRFRSGNTASRSAPWATRCIHCSTDGSPTPGTRIARAAGTSGGLRQPIRDCRRSLCGSWCRLPCGWRRHFRTTSRAEIRTGPSDTLGPCPSSAPSAAPQNRRARPVSDSRRTRLNPDSTSGVVGMSGGRHSVSSGA